MREDDYTLLMRSLDEALGVDEAERLVRLTESSEEARRALDELQSVRHVVGEHGGGTFGPGFADAVMQRLPARPALHAVDRPPRPSKPRRASSRMRWVGAAVAAVLVVAVGLAWWMRPTGLDAARGTTEVATLPDGSTVELAGGTSMQYSRLDWWTDRTVQLDGEAFFDVVEDGRPFVVQTADARVEVRGTRFNVEAWDDARDRGTVVTVAAGSVAVAPRVRPEVAVVLRPGEMTTVSRDAEAPTRPAVAELDRALAWRTGGLAFADQRLGRVFSVLERRFGVTITLDDATLADLSLTYLNPQPASIEAVLSDICHTRGLRYRRTADGYEVYQR